ncbi:MAG: thiamine pyrophosphate-dependent enzyme, partial [Anaerolineae bacterium]
TVGVSSSGSGVRGKDFAHHLEEHRYNFLVGVPCSLLQEVLAALATRPRLYVAAVREDAAVGCAAGAWLAGGRAAILIQNSGLGTSLNALASLSLMYKLPCLLVVTWRGFQGKDAPEHLLMGDITPRLLDLTGIPHRMLSGGSVDADLAWATREAETRETPAALLLPPGVMAANDQLPRDQQARSNTTPGDTRSPLLPSAPGQADVQAGAGSVPSATLAPAMSRYEALSVAIRCLGDEPVIHANGYICRESFAVADRPQNFYMIGSMGLASSIGLGVALTQPGRKTVIFDGDGNLLMNLGTLAMVGGLRPKNFVHLVFDNEVYGSTGDQPSLSQQVRLDRLAAAAGYPRVHAVADAAALEAATRNALSTDGPVFILVKVTAEARVVPRIPYSPPAIRDRFRSALLAK